MSNLEIGELECFSAWYIFMLLPLLFMSYRVSTTVTESNMRLNSEWNDLYVYGTITIFSKIHITLYN